MSKQAKWRNKTLPVGEIIERRVHNKNKAYDRWRRKWTSQKLEKFCVEASFRFGGEPHITVSRFNYPAMVAAKKEIAAWRKELRHWCLKAGVANNVTEAAQFRKYYNSWYSWTTKGKQ